MNAVPAAYRHAEALADESEHEQQHDEQQRPPFLGAGGGGGRRQGARQQQNLGGPEKTSGELGGVHRRPSVLNGRHGQGL